MRLSHRTIVAKDGIARRVWKDVVCIDISMADAKGVQVCQSRGDAGCYPQKELDLEASAVIPTAA